MIRMPKTLLAVASLALATTTLIAPEVGEASKRQAPAAQKKPSTTAQSATRQRPANPAPRNRQVYSGQTRPQQREANRDAAARRNGSGNRVVASSPAASPAPNAGPSAGTRPQPINVARSPLTSFSAAGRMLAQSAPATRSSRRTPSGMNVTFRDQPGVTRQMRTNPGRSGQPQDRGGQ